LPPTGAVRCVARSKAGSTSSSCAFPRTRPSRTASTLGCTAGTLDDLESEIERLLALGATIAWEEEFPPEMAARYRNLVLRDPEGNEFCLGAGTPPT
jgi:hypothetical protein